MCLTCGTGAPTPSSGQLVLSLPPHEERQNVGETARLTPPGSPNNDAAHPFKPGDIQDSGATSNECGCGWALHLGVQWSSSLVCRRK
jgi:hypothetical protein